MVVDHIASTLEQRERFTRLVAAAADREAEERYTPAFAADAGDTVVTMTTCKRLELFVRTVDSLLYAFKDLWAQYVTELVVVDDNSSVADRAVMQTTFPWIRYVFKNAEDRGHARSMNIIRSQIAPGATYIVHIEDDFLFLERDATVFARMRKILDAPAIEQVLFNPNYIETERDMAVVVGGIYHETFIEHEYVTTDAERTAFRDKWQQLGTTSSNYWPHFSLRPGMMKTETLCQLLPPFDETPHCHFEMVMGQAFVERGFKTAFLPDAKHLHIGKLTHETGRNAYTLNQVPQFGRKCAVRHVCINLDARPDRWARVSQHFADIGLEVQRVSAVDGKTCKVTPQLVMLFEKNDFRYRASMVGCALSHINLWIEHAREDASSWLNVMEDDVEIHDQELHWTLTDLAATRVPADGVLFWTYHARSSAPAADPALRKVSAHEALSLSYGGTAGYMVSAASCRALLQFIARTSVTNGIDTVIQKSGLAVYLPKQLGWAPMVGSGDDAVDSDIQFCYECLDTTFSLQDEMRELGVEFVAEKQLPDHVVLYTLRGTDPRGRKWSYIARPGVIVEILNASDAVCGLRPRTRL